MLALYRTIWKASWRSQIALILVSLGIAALAAVPLSYQKDIINVLTEKSVGFEDLLVLCAEMLGFILLSLALKWMMGYRASVLGEGITRRIRVRLYTAGIEWDTEHRGTLTTAISAEAEELGKFTGSSISEPVMQLGTLVAVIGYIASTQPGLGLIALGIIAPQVVLVLTTQRKVNALVAERVRRLRRASDTISVAKVAETEQAVLDDFDGIFNARRTMFIWKLSTKFLLSTLNGVGTVVVLALGGWMVLEGKTDVGTVVAAGLGLGRLQGPTGFLIAFYRQVSAMRVKFELLLDIAPSRKG